MTDTTRYLIQRLAGELQEWIDYAPIGPCDDEQALIDEARTLLAQPEPEGPTEEEIDQLSHETWKLRKSTQWAIRTALARWGRPAVEPEPKDKVLARVEFAKGDFNGPFDAILAQYCNDWFYGDPERTEVDPVDLCRGAIKLFAQAYALPIPPATKKP